MARFQTLGKWLTASDAVLGVGEKVVKTLVWALGGGTIVTGVLGAVIAAVTNNLLYGLVAGVVAGMVVLGAFTFKAIGIAASGAQASSVQKSDDAAAEPIASSASDFQLWQELKRVESENEELRAALQQSEQENEELRDWIVKITPFKQRLQLKWTLEAIGRMGNNLQKRDPPDVVATERWVSLTSNLIRRYYDDETADFFLVRDGDNSFAGRLSRLQQVADKAVDFMNYPKPSDFDITEAIEPYPSEWANKYGV